MHKRKQVWADKGMEVIGSEGVRSRGDVMPTAGTMRCLRSSVRTLYVHTFLLLTTGRTTYMTIKSKSKSKSHWRQSKSKSTTRYHLF